MATTAWLVLGLVAWVLIGIPVALFVGRMIRLRDNPPPSGHGPSEAADPDLVRRPSDHIERR